MTGPRFVAPTPQALADCVRDLLSPFRHDAVDLVAGIDAMGFILGTGSLARSRQKREGGGGGCYSKLGMSKACAFVFRGTGDNTQEGTHLT